MMQDPTDPSKQIPDLSAPRANKFCDGSNGNLKIYISEEYFYRDILHTYNDDCTVYDTKTTMGQGTTFQWQIFLS
jgi:hypothetical protein